MRAKEWGWLMSTPKDDILDRFVNDLNALWFNTTAELISLGLTMSQAEALLTEDVEVFISDQA